MKVERKRGTFRASVEAGWFSSSARADRSGTSARGAACREHFRHQANCGMVPPEKSRIPAMRRIVVLAALAALAPQAAAAHVVRHGEMPQAYRGTWAPGTGPCKDGDAAAIVLTAKTYAGPAGSCTIEYVSETATPRGAMFSARLRCSGAGGQAHKAAAANLIIRPAGADRISAGPTFDKLTTHRRCSAGEQGAQK
jgi:hypothetical protein